MKALLLRHLLRDIRCNKVQNSLNIFLNKKVVNQALNMCKATHSIKFIFRLTIWRKSYLLQKRFDCILFSTQLLTCLQHFCNTFNIIGYLFATDKTNFFFWTFLTLLINMLKHVHKTINFCYSLLYFIISFLRNVSLYLFINLIEIL